jgi:hypothetical protein
LDSEFCAVRKIPNKPRFQKLKTQNRLKDMKKTIITTLAAGAVSLSSFGQGSLALDAAVNNNPGVAIQGANANSPANASLSSYFTGTVSLEVFALASATQAQLNAINAFINTANGGNAALALAQSDGFVEVSTTTAGGSTVGSVSGSVVGGSFAFSPSTIGLIGGANGVTTSATEALLLYAVAVGGQYAGDSGVVAFNNNTGGSLVAVPAGTPASLNGWGVLNQNLVLSPVPEPTTMALAGLGSLSLFLFRRKK